MLVGALLSSTRMASTTSFIAASVTRQVRDEATRVLSRREAHSQCASAEHAKRAKGSAEVEPQGDPSFWAY